MKKCVPVHHSLRIAASVIVLSLTEPKISTYGDARGGRDHLRRWEYPPRPISSAVVTLVRILARNRKVPWIVTRPLAVVPLRLTCWATMFLFTYRRIFRPGGDAIRDDMWRIALVGRGASGRSGPL